MEDNEPTWIKTLKDINTLLVGMQTDTATMENSMEIP